MGETNLGSITIDGVGTYAGGEYDVVSISGKGTISSDLSCNMFTTSGSSKVCGKMKCSVLKSSGTCKIEGTLEAEEMSTSGTFQSLDDIKADHIQSNGMLTARSHVRGTKIESNGTIYVEKNLSAEEFILNGMLTCNGDLNSEKVSMTLVGTSKVSEIGGSTIRIEPKTEFIGVIGRIFMPKRFHENMIIVDSIEGDSIYVENCQAGRINGGTVIVGPGCTIGSVEYSEELQIHESSVVEQYSKKE